MAYTVTELADKFAFAAKKFVEDKENEARLKKRNSEERYDKAYRTMLDCQTRRFADVGILADSIYDYLNVIHERPRALGKSLYQPYYENGFLNVGRKYFIYNCCCEDRYCSNGIFLAILIEYKTGYIYHATLSDTDHRPGDYANIVNPDYIHHVINPKTYVNECRKDKPLSTPCLDNLDYFSDALEQIPERIEALFKYAVAFADTVDGNLAMADYMAKYRR